VNEPWPWRDRLAQPKFGSGPGLHRVRALASDLLARPWARGLDALKVTGSNGKGSVAAVLEALLRELGLRTGLFTSPHLFAFEERLRVDGVPLDAPALDAAWDATRGRLEAWQAACPDDGVGAFEALTVQALHAFERAGVGVLVAEAGIGGRHDPTRVIPGRVAALTSLDLEHTALLGATLREIACDKADLCPEGGTLVTWVDDDEARMALGGHCAARGVSLIDARRAGRILRASPTPEGQRLDLALGAETWRDVDLALRGPHQARNALLALWTAREWLRAARPSLPAADFEAAARRALAGVVWPLRFERIRRDPDVFADVGHTPDALRSLAAGVRHDLGGRRVLLLTGVSHDKDAQGILAALAPLAASAVATQAHHKGRAAHEIADLLRRQRPELEVEVEGDIAHAAERACTRAADEGAVVLIAGGLFLAAEAVHALRGGDPRALQFF
jgi:dihydrofolate synthase/folylpolyglutamate synthase